MSYPVCPKCGTRVRVDTSKRHGDQQIRWHRCKCGWTATRVVPVSEIFQRAPGKR